MCLAVYVRNSNQYYRRALTGGVVLRKTFGFKVIRNVKMILRLILKDQTVYIQDQI